MKLYRCEVTTTHVFYAYASSEGVAERCSAEAVKTDPPSEEHVKVRAVKPGARMFDANWDEHCLVYGDHGSNIMLGDVWPKAAGPDGAPDAAGREKP